jgi:hypothetical protein
VRSPESLYEYLMDKLKQSDKEALEWIDKIKCLF